MDNTYKVYAKHKSNLVYHIYSTCFEDVQDGDVFIKEGYGDEFVHVGYYQVLDFNGCHNYKIVDGEMIETTEEEKQKEFEENKIDICPTKTIEERVEELEQENKLLKQENQMLHTQVEAITQNQEFVESCMMEMAQVVYA